LRQSQRPVQWHFTASQGHYALTMPPGLDDLVIGLTYMR